jgi:cytochrome c5
MDSELPETYTEHQFTPKGGFNKKDNIAQQVAQHQEIISEWHGIAGLRPEGSPVGLTQAKDGSLWIVDDRNAAILRLSNGKAYIQNGKHNQQITRIEIPSGVMSIFKEKCSQCHEEISKNPTSLFNQTNWLRKENGQYLLETKIFFDKTRPMPPTGGLTVNEKDQLKNWLDRL